MNSGNIPYEAGWHSQLAKEIVKNSRNYDVECWGIDKNLDNQLQFKEGNITYRLFPSTNLRFFGEVSPELIQELYRLAMSERIIIHIHRVFSYTTYLIPLLIRTTPIIIQHHGDISCLQGFYEANKIKDKKALAHLLLYILRQEWLFERLTLRRIDRLFVLNDDAMEYFLPMIDNNKIEKLTMGIDFELFTKMDKIAARSLLGLGKDKKYILYSGAFVKRKGLEYLLRAMSILLRDHENYFLILKGDGYYRDDLESLAREIGIYSNIIFVPWVEKAKLPIYYNAADVCVLPSLDEGLGITAVEALACETPFIGSDVGGIPDVVRNFGMGVLVKPRDAEAIAEAILTLLGQKQELRPDRENARRYYGWEQIAKRNIEIYDELWATYWENENHNNISN
ncbi:glycosyltransferase family 4 protein [bacterium]|nr:MAG: glycosyltransferase family 4 protein [bacterium]